MEVKIFDSPLVDAAKRGNSDDIEKLSEVYVKKKTKKQEFYPALYIAAFQGYENIVRTLLSKGADPNYCLQGCLPPLHAAAQKGRLSIAKLLLDHGADVNPKLRGQYGSRISEKAEYFSSPLLTAARGGHAKMVQMLLDKGADINARLNSTSVKVPHQIERLFAFGDYSDSNISSNSSILGYTPLHFAIEAGEKSVVKLLLKHGADVNSKSDMGESPLALAVEKDEESIIQILKKAGADMNVEIVQLMMFREMFGVGLKRKELISVKDSNGSNSEDKDSREVIEMESTSIKKYKISDYSCIIS
ncbi:ankyrin-1-like isoform X2 [Belonocnema kinseyi]|uniref:ankyrin-1-like isoform X2 n=1 Tax=Belonocnema kinseyi TaxID=2817044 RepID=UPI00143DDF19|nr:ankyrin-1-like isoform X2 [Belonocnema kinseyi]